MPDDTFYPDTTTDAYRKAHNTSIARALSGKTVATWGTTTGMPTVNQLMAEQLLPDSTILPASTMGDAAHLTEICEADFCFVIGVYDGLSEMYKHLKLVDVMLAPIPPFSIAQFGEGDALNVVSNLPASRFLKDKHVNTRQISNSSNVDIPFEALRLHEELGEPVAFVSADFIIEGTFPELSREPLSQPELHVFHLLRCL